MVTPVIASISAFSPPKMLVALTAVSESNGVGAGLIAPLFSVPPR